MPFDNPNADVVGGVSLQTIVAIGVPDPAQAQSCRCIVCTGRMPPPPATGWFPGEATPEVRETLTKARALIAEGWAKGADVRELPHVGRVYCMRGAIRAVAGICTPAERAAMMQLSRFTPGMVPAASQMDPYDANESRVVAFNDWGGTTQADVLAVFDRALE